RVVGDEDGQPRCALADLARRHRGGGVVAMTALFAVAVLGALLVSIAILYAASRRGIALRRNPGKRQLGAAQLLVGLLWISWGALAVAGVGHLRSGEGLFGLVLGALWALQGLR